MIIIICPLCENIKLSDEEIEAIESGEMEAPIIEFEDAEAYAEHIRDFHQSDLRYVWASNFLDNLDKQRELAKQELDKRKLEEEARIKSEQESKNNPNFILGASIPNRELTTEEKVDLILKKMNEPTIQKPIQQIEKKLPIPPMKDKPKRSSSVLLITGVIILIGIVAIIFIMRR